MYMVKNMVLYWLDITRSQGSCDSRTPVEEISMLT